MRASIEEGGGEDGREWKVGMERGEGEGRATQKGRMTRKRRGFMRMTLGGRETRTGWARTQTSLLGTERKRIKKKRRSGLERDRLPPHISTRLCSSISPLSLGSAALNIPKVQTHDHIFSPFSPHAQTSRDSPIQIRYLFSFICPSPSQHPQQPGHSLSTVQCSRPPPLTFIQPISRQLPIASPFSM